MFVSTLLIPGRIPAIDPASTFTISPRIIPKLLNKSVKGGNIACKKGVIALFRVAMAEHRLDTYENNPPVISCCTLLAISGITVAPISANDCLTGSQAFLRDCAADIIGPIHVIKDDANC